MAMGCNWNVTGEKKRALQEIYCRDGKDWFLVKDRYD
jgi:hypothetical protein